MAFNIDLDRGVLINRHPVFGMDVFMYINAPGEYLSAHGTPVDEKTAAESGFDIERYGKDREKRKRMDAARIAIENELAIEGARKHEVVKEAGGLQLVDLGSGRFQVENADGSMLHKEPLSEQLATRLFEQLQSKAAPWTAAAK